MGNMEGHGALFGVLAGHFEEIECEEMVGNASGAQKQFLGIGWVMFLP